MFDSIFKCIASLLLIGTLHADDGLPNPSPRPQSQLRTVDVFAKALYWYTSETLDWAFTLADHGKTVQSAYQTFVFDWAPGFSVGLGYNMEQDRWDTQASYTWFHSKASAQAGNGSITPGFFGARVPGIIDPFAALEPFSTGGGTFTIHYNMFDWDLGRKFFVSEYLCLRPSIGVKGGWIKQNIHSHWEKPGISAFENLKQTFQAGGPKSGITGKWCFGNLRKQAFSLQCLFEAAYLWGHWTIHDLFKATSTPVKYYIQTTPRNYGSLTFHSFFGLGWDCNFNRDRSHIELKLGYEIEDWLNQAQFFTDIAGSQNSDLVLQGLTAGFDVEF